MTRWQASTPEVTDDLYQQMEAAAARLDFEEARRLRDRIALLRGGADESEAAADASGLMRQQPGNMGIGSSVPKPERPQGWLPPKKPDPMTRATGRRRAVD